MNKETKVIFVRHVAQYLLSHGCKIVDLQPKHLEPDKTVFIFKVDDNFTRAFLDYHKNKNNLGVD